jgi:hypothetical protein
MTTTETTETTEARRAVLVHVADSFGATSLDPYGSGDPSEDWAQVSPVPKWVAVTVRFDRCEAESCGAGGTVWFTGHDSRDYAEFAATCYLCDDVAPEAPLAVVDLDSGQVYRVVRDQPVTLSFALASTVSA